MQKEIWNPIEGFEGLYEVSNFGSVRSLNRQVNASKGKIQRILGKKINPVKNKKEYLMVGLWKDGHHFSRYIHRLVATTFIPNPLNLPQVNHKDENKSNNCYLNLEWCTSKYNMNYGSVKSKISDANRNNRYWSRCVRQYSLDGDFISEYPSASEAQRVTGIEASSIRKVCKGKPKHNTAGGFIWKEDVHR